MDPLHALIGQERSLGDVARAFHFWARERGAEHHGAVLVTCSDEAERECAEAFQKGFVDYLLPPLKFAQRSAFRLANIGGRYEWGAATLAEDRFVPPKPGTRPALLVAKVNAHVAWEDRPVGSEPPFRVGIWERYGQDSPCCGALSGLLAGGQGPVTDALREDFTSEGKDRLGALQDEARVDPLLRPLAAAIVSARLQARKAVLELQDRLPPAPDTWLVAPCATLNRHERDTEILCGLYAIEGGEEGRTVTYTGLGDDPARYRMKVVNRRLSVSDGEVGQQRAGRDHRRIAGEMARSRGRIRVPQSAEQRLERVREDVARNEHRQHSHARALLGIALPILAEVAPVPAALFAFAQGAAGIHHAYKIHRLAGKMKGDEEARRMLEEIEAQIDRLDGDRAQALLELLLNEYSPASA